MFDVIDIVGTTCIVVPWPDGIVNDIGDTVRIGAAACVTLNV